VQSAEHGKTVAEPGRRRSTDIRPAAAAPLTPSSIVTPADPEQTPLIPIGSSLSHPPIDVGGAFEPEVANFPDRPVSQLTTALPLTSFKLKDTKPGERSFVDLAKDGSIRISFTYEDIDERETTSTVTIAPGDTRALKEKLVAEYFPTKLNDLDLESVALMPLLNSTLGNLNVGQIFTWVENSGLKYEKGSQFYA
jgi:hypothetical protein